MAFITPRRFPSSTRASSVSYSHNRFLALTLTDARAYARIMEDKRRSGAPLDDHVPDTFLAAAAASRGLAVVTRNASKFRPLRAQVVAFAEQRRHDLRRRTVDEV